MVVTHPPLRGQPPPTHTTPNVVYKPRLDIHGFPEFHFVKHFLGNFDADLDGSYRVLNDHQVKTKMLVTETDGWIRVTESPAFSVVATPENLRFPDVCNRPRRYTISGV